MTMSRHRRRSAALVATLAAALSALPALYALIVRVMIRRAVRQLNAGNVAPLLNTYAADATLVFPGQHSWGAEYRGKDEIEAFLRRFVRVRLQLEPHEIVVKGPPWGTTICLRFENKATAPDGTVVYANRGIIYGESAWGKIRFQEDYEDTQKVAEFDEWLASHEPTGA